MQKISSMITLLACATLLSPALPAAEKDEQKQTQRAQLIKRQMQLKENDTERAAYEALINGEATKAPKEQHLLPKDHLASTN